VPVLPIPPTSNHFTVNNLAFWHFHGMEEVIGSILKAMINAMGVRMLVFGAEPTSPMQIKLTLFLTFALSQDDEGMRPRQLSYQWCDFLVALISLVELPHAK
jgi:hypothetical protein